MVAVDLIIDLQTEKFKDAIFDTLFVVPTVFMLIVITYMIRKKILKSIFYKKLSSKNKFKQQSFIIAIVIIQAVFYCFITRLLSHYFFDDDGDEALFDSLFWILLISIFVIILFVYLLEAFLESENEKMDMIINLKDYENEKAIANYNSLKKQLNPHFLFNSFNSLIGLISTEPDKAEYFIQELSSIYRYTLSKSEEIVVSLEKEMKLINSYIALQQIRFKDLLILNNRIEPDKLQLFLPPMTLELLVENAIKHNMISKEKPLEIEISTHGNYILVKNQYQPKISKFKETSLGIGLKNLVNQYKLITSEVPDFYLKEGQYVAKIPLIKSDV